MYNLTNSGLSLRTIKPKDLDQFAADLNHNFMSILNATGFKGMPGASIQGPAGIGIRGSKWFFVANRIAQFITTYGLTGGDQVTLAFLNTALSSNQVQLGTVVGLTTSESFVEGDSIVLLSGQVVQLAMVTVGATTTPTWIDTGITFQQTLGVTETRVIELINSMLGDPSDTDAIFRRYAAIAKNHSDASPGVNSSLNTDSVLDIPTTGSGPGTVYTDNYFIAAKEQAIGELTKMCLLAGSPQQYHNLVQQTQEALTNNYAPGVDDFAAGIFLQNSYNNGIIMGHRDSSTIKEFARWYKTTTEAVLTSHYSPNPLDYSEIRMAKSNLFLRGDLECRIQTAHFINLGDRMTTKFFSYNGNLATIADASANHGLEIYAKAGIWLKNHLSKQILSTDATGKITSIYTVIDNLALATSNNQLVGALALQALATQVNTNTSNITNNTNTLNKRAWLKRDWKSGTTDLNALTEHGNYNIVPGSTINNFIPNFTTSTVDMHVNVIIMNPVDESQFVIMQEVTYAGLVEGSFMNSNKWFRLGNRTETDAWVFSAWTVNVTGANKVKASNGLHATGSFNSDNMQINHNLKDAELQDSENAGNQVIQNLEFDDYGHVINYTTTDIQGVPTGTVIWFAASTPPTGFLKCNGAYISKTTYSTLWSIIGTFFGTANSASFALPDLRGKFVRAWTDGSNIDIDRTFGSYQLDSMQRVTGTIGDANQFAGVIGGSNGAFYRQAVGLGQGAAGGSADQYHRISFDNARVARTSTETRPKNVALLACIKY